MAIVDMIEVTSKICDTEKDKKDPKKIIDQNDLVVSKKTRAKNFLSNFIKRDFEDIRDYIVYETLIPGLKEGFLSAIEFILTDKVNGKKHYHSDREDYRKYYNKSEKRSYRREQKENENCDYREIVIKRRDPAEQVVDNMRDRIEEYGYATVADLYRITGYASSYVDNNWGWEDPREIGIRRVKEGFLINVEEAKYLGR